MISDINTVEEPELSMGFKAKLKEFLTFQKSGEEKYISFLTNNAGFYLK